MNCSPRTLNPPSITMSPPNVTLEATVWSAVVTLDNASLPNEEILVST